ncbi:hypothetical protein PHYC_01275 [Phycisphaerales bacterium]|nr:hypothetical protein PHYC_01275 [Phycisphaerales bacterium]
MLRFVGLTTDSTLRQRFTAADGGKTAYYQLRWLGNGGERGPWSDVASATVAA